jgi:hypothetical protein
VPAVFSVRGFVRLGGRYHMHHSVVQIKEEKMLVNLPNKRSMRERLFCLTHGVKPYPMPMRVSKGVYAGGCDEI